MKSKILYLALAALSMSACHNNSNTDASTPMSMDSAAAAAKDTVPATATASNSGGSVQAMKDDSAYLVKANDIGMFEIKIGELAKVNSQDANVKEMAGMMIQDHTDFGKKVMAQAQKENITLPAALCDDNQKEYDKLSGLNGKKFDKEYADVNVKGHKEAIGLFEKTSKNQDCSADVQQLAASALPTLKKHKEHADMLKTQIKM